MVLDITCDVIETSGGVQPGSTDPELCNLFHQIAPSIEPARYFQYYFSSPVGSAFGEDRSVSCDGEVLTKSKADVSRDVVLWKIKLK